MFGQIRNTNSWTLSNKWVERFLQFMLSMKPQRHTHTHTHTHWPEQQNRDRQLHSAFKTRSKASNWSRRELLKACARREPYIHQCGLRFRNSRNTYYNGTGSAKCSLELSFNMLNRLHSSPGKQQRRRRFSIQVSDPSPRLMRQNVAMLSSRSPFSTMISKDQVLGFCYCQGLC